MTKMTHNDGITVLSLFDGMSGGQQALERRGIKVAKYYASEIDKHAMSVTMNNYPDTVQLGSVVDLDVSNLPKIDLLMGGSPCQSFSFAGKRKGMSTKDSIEILTLSHYLQLKEEEYAFEGQSYLFWEYMRVLEDLRKVNPNIKFLLENVLMGEKWEKVLSKAIGVNAIEINSALVSAQNRKRLYWTNIGMKASGLFGDLASIIAQPKDKGILLKDILEKEVADKYFLSDKMLKYFKTRAANFNNGRVNIRDKDDKATCLTASMASCDISDNFVAVDCNGKGYTDKAGALLARYASDPSNFGGDTYIKLNTDLKISKNQGKAGCLSVGGNSGGLHSDMDLIGCVKFGRTDEAKKIRKENMAKGVDHTPFAQKEINGIDFEKMNTLSTVVNKDNLIIQLNASTESGGNQPYQQNRVYDIEGISPALNTDSRCHAILVPENPNDVFMIQRERGFNNGGKTAIDGKTPTLTKNSWEHNNHLANFGKIRRLTPLECERLQTVKDGYTEGASDTQRYRMLGNGWTIDVIAHILSYL